MTATVLRRLNEDTHIHSSIGAPGDGVGGEAGTVLIHLCIPGLSIEPGTQ